MRQSTVLQAQITHLAKTMDYQLELHQMIALVFVPLSSQVILAKHSSALNQKANHLSALMVVHLPEPNHFVLVSAQKVLKVINVKSDTVLLELMGIHVRIMVHQVEHQENVAVYVNKVGRVKIVIKRIV